MRILITNLTLAGRTGTEIVVRDLAIGLKRRGHEPLVYSPQLGPIASEIASAGVLVTDDLTRITDPPDIIHGHHHVETIEALLRFPETPAIFVLHDRLAWHDVPPPLPQIAFFVAVDFNCLERLSTGYDISREKTRVIFNAIDLRRFPRRTSLPEKPRRALVFSNQAHRTNYLPAIEKACAELNLPLDVVGAASGRQAAAPESVLVDYDLVFAKARCATEAMAVGAAVVLCDTRGLGSMVTAAEVAQMRPWNFGMRLLDLPIEPSGIVKEIEKYNATDALAVSAFIREHAGLDQALDQYLALYQEVLKAPRPDGAPALRDVLRLNAIQTRDLEGKLALLSQPHRSEPLPADLELRLVVEDYPPEVAAGSEFQAMVRLENGSGLRIHGFPPCPVNLSYHFLSSDTGLTVIFEGRRTALLPPLEPHSENCYRVSIAAPAVDGVYTLRLTLVQEGVRWLDELDPPLCADLPITVQPAAS